MKRFEITLYCEFTVLVSMKEKLLGQFCKLKRMLITIGSIFLTVGSKEFQLYTF